MRAEREVILSAGAYQSPVLLMLSGIGPAEELAPLGIAIREELPVGRNLQDHCMAQLNYTTDEPTLFGTFTPENFALLQERGSRPAHLEHPGGRRVLPDAARARRAGRGVPLRTVDVLRRGAHRAERERLLLRSRRGQAEQPWTR